MNSVKGVANNIISIAKSDDNDNYKIERIKTVVKSNSKTFYEMTEYFENLIESGYGEELDNNVNRRMFIGPQTTQVFNKIGINTPDQRSYVSNINISRECLRLLELASKDYCIKLNPSCGGSKSRYSKRKTSRKRNQKNQQKKVKKTRKSRKIRR